MLLFAKQTSGVNPINAAEMRTSIDAVIIERNTKIIAIINSLARAENNALKYFR